MKYNATTLQKLEKILDESEFVLRYEKGNFQSGYCLLEHRKVVVINKFLHTESRINILLDIIPALPVNQDALTHESQKLYAELLSRQESASPDPGS